MTDMKAIFLLSLGMLFAFLCLAVWIVIFRYYIWLDIKKLFNILKQRFKEFRGTFREFREMDRFINDYFKGGSDV